MVLCICNKNDGLIMNNVHLLVNVSMKIGFFYLI